MLKARVARRADHFPEAEKELETCKRLKVSRDAVALELAMLEVQQGKLTPELETFLKACADEGHPDTMLILEALSRGYAHNYRLHDAQDCLDRWLERQPDDVQALLGRGWVYERLGKYEEALEDYRRASAVDPEREEPALRHAQVLLYLGEPAEADGEFERLRQRFPQDLGVALGFAQCQVKLGRTEEARQLLDQLAADHPREAEVLRERGNLAHQTGQAEEAETWLRGAMAQAPYDYQVHYDLYQCLLRVGKAAEAQALQARMQRIQADLVRINDLTQELQNRPYDAGLRSEIGRIFLRNGELHEGVLWLESALQVNPAHQPTHQALADYYAEAGQSALAAQHRALAGKSDAPAAGN
jgi:tetratricopeptide (TPR) repeat protein